MARPSRNMKRRHIFLTDRQEDFVEKEAKRLGVSFSEALRRLLDRMMDSRRGW